MSLEPLPGEAEILATPVAAVAPDEVPGPPQRRGFLLLFVLAWFGIALVAAGVGGAAIPKVFAFLDDETKGFNLSVTSAVGGIVAMVITPLAGRLSDRTMSRLGKRRPWILGGAIFGMVGVVVLAFSSSLWTVVLGWSIG